MALTHSFNQVYVFAIRSCAIRNDTMTVASPFSMRKIRALPCKWSPHMVRTRLFSLATGKRQHMFIHSHLGTTSVCHVRPKQEDLIIAILSYIMRSDCHGGTIWSCQGWFDWWVNPLKLSTYWQLNILMQAQIIPTRVYSFAPTVTRWMARTGSCSTGSQFAL